MNARKVAIITGASQGIGAGLVVAYQELGYAVVANSRSIAPSTRESLATVAGDIADPATAAKLVTTAVERFGRVDTLVNNAGVFIAKPFVDYDVDDLAKALSTNLAGFFHISQAVIRQLLTQGEGGHIVNITASIVESALSLVPSVLASLTKGGVASATKQLAVEYAPAGIRVNAISPGIIQTPMHTQETHEFLATLNPLKRLGEIEDVARGAIFLEQSPFVTGEFLHVDGGHSAGH